MTAWTIFGADGETIFGDEHVPEGRSRGAVVIAHGFKGYKDYGMFPHLAAACAEAGCVAERFNFSHSGMTNDLETFARPDLFQRDTWNRQVEDLEAVCGAIRDGTIGGPLEGGAPPRIILFGHSRGGLASLLAAARWATEGGPRIDGIVTAAAPSRCCSLPDDQRTALLRDGALPSPSSRTGQTLLVGRAFLQEQLDDPRRHDLPALAGAIDVPVLLVHGDADPTVPVSCADEIAAAIGANARVVVVPGGDHVFNTANPMPAGAPASPPLAVLERSLVEFLRAGFRDDV